MIFEKHDPTLKTIKSKHFEQIGLRTYKSQISLYLFTACFFILNHFTIQTHVLACAYTLEGRNHSCGRTYIGAPRTTGFWINYIDLAIKFYPCRLCIKESRRSDIIQPTSQCFILNSHPCYFFLILILISELYKTFNTLKFLHI